MPLVGETQALEVVVRDRSSRPAERVEWPLDGATLRALIEVFLSSRGLLPLPSDVRGVVSIAEVPLGSLDRTLRACLDEAVPTRLPTQRLELVIDASLGRAAVEAIERRAEEAGRLHAERPPPTAPIGAPVRPSRPLPFESAGASPLGSPGSFAPAMPPHSPAVPPKRPDPSFGMPAPSIPTQSPPTQSPPTPTQAPPDAPVIVQPPKVPGVREARPGESLLNYVSRATVEYFTRMTPQKVFPLKVTLSPYSSDHRLAPDVARAESDTFTVEPSKWIEVEPVLPGCTVYPAKQSVPGGTIVSELRFWVVPTVKGDVPGVVYVRHASQQRAVRLKITVAEPRTAAWTAAAGAVLPYLSVILKRERLDFESQVADGYSAYLLALRWVLRVLGPTQLCVLLLVAATVIWARRRPRKASANDLDSPLYAT